MAFMKCPMFEIELNNGEVKTKAITDEVPDWVIKQLEDAVDYGVPPYITNPDNFIAKGIALGLGLEYTPGTSSEREVNIAALAPVF